MKAMNVETAGTGMSIGEMKVFIRNHFEQFVNRKNLEITDANFAADFVDHGTDVPPGTAPGPAGAKQYVGSALKKFPDMSVTIEGMIAEVDRVVVGLESKTSCVKGRRSNQLN